MTIQMGRLDLPCIAYIFVLCPVEDGGKKVMNRLRQVASMSGEHLQGDTSEW